MYRYRLGAKVINTAMQGSLIFIKFRLCDILVDKYLPVYWLLFCIHLFGLCDALVKKFTFIYHLLFWAAVRSAMPSFYEKMKTRLRSADEGADTVVWLAMSDAALSHPSGLFYQGINLSSNTLQLLCAQSFGQQHFRSFIIGKVTKYNRSSTEKPVITWPWMIHHKIIDTYILTVLYLYNYKFI